MAFWGHQEKFRQTEAIGGEPQKAHLKCEMSVVGNSGQWPLLSFTHSFIQQIFVEAVKLTY